MADNEILASASGRASTTFATRSLLPAEAGSLIHAAKFRSGDVQKIQPPRAVNDSYRPGRWSFAGEDLGAPDSRNVARAKLGDKNKGLRASNVLREGVRVGPRAQSSAKAVHA
ncbi:hypothetical protein A6U87_16345 [Rhizobium sp. AC44/96]|nr:hypothetical protein A6U87_16345 [Rhizobium sp. AC44/96]